MLAPIGAADRNEGAFAIRAIGTQAVIWFFLSWIRFAKGRLPIGARRA